MALAFLSTPSFAQSPITMALAAGDTCVNTATITRIIGGAKFTGAYKGIAVQVVISKISGTGAGTLTLQGSLDGTNYVAIGSAYTITNVATQSITFYVAAPIPAYVRVSTTGSGTESIVQTYLYKLNL